MKVLFLAFYSGIATEFMAGSCSVDERKVAIAGEMRTGQLEQNNLFSEKETHTELHTENKHAPGGSRRG